MGWSSGTELFDRVISAIQDRLQYVIEAEGLEDDLKDVYIEIIDAFRDHDWDDLCGSDYHDHPVIGPLLTVDEEEDFEY
jgi:hypothetical protein